jgi:anti-sigma regulatory factor (Ser/Thr protein kinase)
MNAPRLNFPPYHLRQKFPASLKKIDDICRRLRRQMARLHCPHLSFEVEIILREMLTNAVRHGCRFDKQRQVRFHLTLCPAYLRILVADSGAGFDWQRQLRKRSPQPASNGRGLKIVQHYCNAMRFNKRGNVLLIKRRF